MTEDDYVSPLKEELNLTTDTFGTGIIIALNKKDKSGVQMNINVWDDQFTKEEMPKDKEHLSIKKEQAILKQQMKDLNKE